MPSCVACVPCIATVPAGSKCIRANPGNGDNKVCANAITTATNIGAMEPHFDIAIGLPWCPKDFVKKACLSRHPRRLEKGVQQILSDCISNLASRDTASVAKFRTEQLPKWYIAAKGVNESFDGPDHCKRILKSKRVNLFEKMLREAGHKDHGLSSTMQQGFDLLGKIPKSGVMPKKTTVTSLNISDLRHVAHHNQRAVLDSAANCRDLDVAREVYRLTKEECDRGWLLGLLSQSDLPNDAVLTRRFGEVRPIDDFTESLANLTSSAEDHRAALHWRYCSGDPFKA